MKRLISVVGSPLSVSTLTAFLLQLYLERKAPVDGRYSEKEVDFYQ